MRDGGRCEGRHGWVLTLRSRAPGCVHEHLGIYQVCHLLLLPPAGEIGGGYADWEAGGDEWHSGQKGSVEIQPKETSRTTARSNMSPVSITVPGMQSSSDCVCSAGDVTGHCYSPVKCSGSKRKQAHEVLLQGSRWLASRQAKVRPPVGTPGLNPAEPGLCGGAIGTGSPAAGDGRR